MLSTNLDYSKLPAEAVLRLPDVLALGGWIAWPFE